MSYKTKKRFKLRKIWRYRYRFYAFVVIILSLFVFRSDNLGSAAVVIPEDSLSFNVVQHTALAKKLGDIIEPESIIIEKVFHSHTNPRVNGKSMPVYIDDDGVVVSTGQEREYYNNLGFIMSKPTVDFSTTEVETSEESAVPSLSDLIPIPSNPERANRIVYPAHRIDAPIIWARDEHMFHTKADGSIDYRNPIIEDPNAAYNGNYTSTPVLKMLKDGAVHLGGVVSPPPGELGNSYLIGHSANYASIISPWNYVFKALKQTPKSKVGEIFYVYDQYGRKLKFKVFETKLIAYDDANTAYGYKKGGGNVFEDRRVITLQTCVSHYIRGQGWIPDQRWLTRGELVLD